MAVKKIKKSNDEYYSRILIYTARRVSFLFLTVCLFLVFVALLWEHNFHERSWLLAVLPITLIAIPVIFFPLTEEWDYKPWQAKPVKYEYFQNDL
jgi:hypothetical protein